MIKLSKSCGQLVESYVDPFKRKGQDVPAKYG